MSTHVAAHPIDSATVHMGHEEFVFPSVKPYYEDPIVLTDGSGVFVRDAEGREFLDFFSGILTTSIGHCHPDVTERVQAQMERLGHTSTLYLTEKQVNVARRLAELSPGGLKKAFFTSSGTEAVDTAIMAARLYTGRTEVIALRHAYHGRSHLATSLTANAAWRPLGVGVPGIVHARAPYSYRSALPGMSDDEAAEYFARDLEEVIQTCTNGAPAAFLAETIMGVGGYIVPPAGYFQRAAEVIRRYGGVFIADEVQAGLGRTGRWFAIEHWGVEPDIMVLAKGIANGYPAAATIAREEIADAWRSKTISTFGGNPVSMAAAEATLDAMVRENVPDRSQVRGSQLRAGLEELFREYEWIGDVRGLGLMQALELVEDRGSKEPSRERARAVLEAAKAEGLLIGLAGVHGNTVRIAPSMLVTADEVDDALGRLRRAFRRVHDRF